MEPVINPWLFYLSEVASAILAVSLFTVILAFITFVYGIVTMLSNEEFGDKDKDYLRGKKLFRTSLVILIISLVIFVFVPSSDTILKMVIAQNVTYDALDAAKDVVVQVYNDILALFQK